MTGEGKRPLAALIVAVLAAALLAACGGSDSDSSGSTEAATTDSSTTTGTTASNDGGGKGNSQAQNGGQSQGDGKGQNDSQGDRSQSQQSNSGGSGSRDVETPLKVSGGGAEQFRSEGGDNSIQEFGDESDETELQEAAEVVHSFYVARAEEKWDTACSYLSKSNIEQLEQLAAQASPAKSADCTTVLEAFTRPLPAAVEREITSVDAGSLRREGDRGFLIYYGAGHQTYAMPLKEEGGAWKVTALSGTTLS